MFEKDFVRAPHAVLDHILLYRILSLFSHAPSTIDLRQHYNIPDSQRVLDEAYKGLDICCAAFGVKPVINIASREDYIHPIIDQLKERRRVEDEGNQNDYTYTLDPRTMEVVMRLLHRLNAMDK